MTTTHPGGDATPNLHDYDEVRRTYDVKVPDRFNAVLDVLDQWAAEEPDALALISLDAAGDLVAEATTADLVSQSRVAARAFLSLGVQPGDPVFVMLPRIPAWYAVVLGAIRIGAVPMPGPTLLTGKDISYRAQRASAKVLVTDAAGTLKVDDVRAELGSVAHTLCVGAGEAAPPGWLDWEHLLADTGDGPTPGDPTAATDPMFLYFTSGTVSLPKMVLHTQASYSIGHEPTARYWQDLKLGDRHWTVSDTGWAKATYGSLFGQWACRATVVQVALGKPDPDAVLGLLARHAITSFCAPPTLYRLLVQADLSKHDLSALRRCTSAGEPLNPEVIRVWEEGTGLTIHDGYGQTETTILVANFPGCEVKPGSMGRPAPGYVVEILDDDGHRAPDGQVGHVAVRTEPRPVGLFQGYAGDPEATASVLRDGWYFTGDKAARDADGYFWFEGRADDVITSSAYRIGPFEVESALLEHPAVAEAAVVGKPDPERTELVTALVILASGYEPRPELAAELQEHCKRVTAPYKYPRLVVFVPELPKTVSGKIRRSELRERLARGDFD